MFASFIQLLAPRRPAGLLECDLAFVRDVTVAQRSPRNRQVEAWLVGGWVLIALKCWVIAWAIGRYHVPVDPLWINVPTILFALLCTAAYIWRS